MKRRRSLGSHARALAALVAGLLLLGAPSAFPVSRDGAGGPTAPCVSTPAEYRAAWEAREVRCVAPSLFGTTHARGQSSPYPSGFRYAWAGSSTNLEQYLKLRARYGAQPAKVGIGVLSYVGYPGLDDADRSGGLPNALFTALPSRVDIPLDLGAPGQRDFLHTGYCR